jgi:hypothetical protein
MRERILEATNPWRGRCVDCLLQRMFVDVSNMRAILIPRWLIILPMGIPNPSPILFLAASETVHFRRLEQAPETCSIAR